MHRVHNSDLLYSAIARYEAWVVYNWLIDKFNYYLCQQYEARKDEHKCGRQQRATYILSLDFTLVRLLGSRKQKQLHLLGLLRSEYHLLAALLHCYRNLVHLHRLPTSERNDRCTVHNPNAPANDCEGLLLCVSTRANNGTVGLAEERGVPAEEPPPIRNSHEEKTEQQENSNLLFTVDVGRCRFQSVRVDSGRGARFFAAPERRVSVRRAHAADEGGDVLLPDVRCDDQRDLCDNHRFRNIRFHVPRLRTAGHFE